MTKATCSIDGCGLGHKARGWCHKHYQRWIAHGDPEYVKVRHGIPASERFAENVDTSGPVPQHAPGLGRCWTWRAGTAANGYGTLRDDSGRTVYAHRYAYLKEHGSLPALLDHICHRRSCVRPSHLRPASRAQNAQNRAGAQPSSTTGARGVFRTRSGRYGARVKASGVTEYLGTYDTVEQADRVVRARRAEVFGKFAGC